MMDELTRRNSLLSTAKCRSLDNSVPRHFIIIQRVKLLCQLCECFFSLCFRIFGEMCKKKVFSYFIKAEGHHMLCVYTRLLLLTALSGMLDIDKKLSENSLCSVALYGVNVWMLCAVNCVCESTTAFSFAYLISRHRSAAMHDRVEFHSSF